MSESDVRQPLYGAAARLVRDQLREPSDLDTAVAVAGQLLADYGDAKPTDLGAVNQALGAVSEALRLVLRAVAAERGEQS